MEKSPYVNGPYLVLDDHSTYSLAQGGFVAYLDENGEKELQETNDFKWIESDNIKIITLDDLMDAYNQVHGADI
jgi:hypothetical protein